jgi:hypothetical protein
MSRSFTPPWRVDEATESFCVRDAKGQALAYVYFEDGDRPPHGDGPAHAGRGATDRCEHC